MSDIVVDGGVLTKQALAGDNTLQDASKFWAPDIHAGKVIIVKTPDQETHAFQIEGNSQNTLVLQTTVTKAIPADSRYSISGFDLDTVLRQTLGGGANVDLPAEFATLAAAMIGGFAPFVPLDRGLIHNAAVLADTDFFAAALAPANTPCLFRIMVAMDTVGVLNATITNGGNTQTAHFNHSVNLGIGDLYMFDLLVHAGDTINFQYSVNATIQVCRVQEIVAGVQ